MIKVQRLKTFLNKQIVKDINILAKQLNPKARQISLADLKRILKNNLIYVALDKKKVIGMASLHFMETCTKKAGLIEGVVVDKDYRRKGIGKKLVQKLIKEAQRKKVYYLDLTSNPKRKEANIMYKKLGFQKRKTNCYRLEL